MFFHGAFLCITVFTPLLAKVLLAYIIVKQPSDIFISWNKVTLLQTEWVRGQVCTHSISLLCTAQSHSVYRRIKNGTATPTLSLISLFISFFLWQAETFIFTYFGCFYNLFSWVIDVLWQGFKPRKKVAKDRKRTRPFPWNQHPRRRRQTLQMWQNLSSVMSDSSFCCVVLRQWLQVSGWVCVCVCVWGCGWERVYDLPWTMSEYTLYF